MTDHITVTQNGPVMELYFNRPEKKNAITDAMYGKLADSLNSADADDNVRAVILTGNGDAFTAGNDLMDFATVNASGKRLEDQNVTRYLHALAGFTKPLIMAVNGLAVGIGTTMCLHADLVFVSGEASFTTPFVNLAVVPEAASSTLMPRLIGHRRAYAMFALGEKVSASDAVSWGIANKLVPLDGLMFAARSAAEKLAAKAPNSLKLTKALMRGTPEDIKAIMAQENVHFGAQLVSAEAGEAFTAFAEKRPPKF